MTPKTITIIILRLFVIYILFGIVSSIGSSLYGIFESELRSLEMIEYQLLQVSIYVIAILVLYTYSEKIADKIVKVVPNERIDTTWTSVELLAILIVAISILTIVSAIPRIVNNLHAILTSSQSELSELLPMKQRFNMFFFGLLGTFFQVIVSLALIFKAKSLAIYLDKIQHKQAP